MENLIKVTGGCHCGAVRFEAEIPPRCDVHICNCSICRMCGFEHLIVPASAFRLISGRKELREYQFESKTARHLFCSKCGLKSFYVPRSNPDGYSLNIRCMELPREITMNRMEFDGRNWSANASRLSQYSAR
jgi:hypothetical protein